MIRRHLVMLGMDTPIPPHGGTRLRLLHLARQTATRDRVTMYAVAETPTVHDAPFELIGVPNGHGRIGSLVRSATKPYLHHRLHSARLASLVAESGADLVQASSIYLMTAGRGAGRPVVLDTHNVETEIVASQAVNDTSRLYRARWRWEARTTRRYEVREVARADAVLACSDDDAAWFEPFAQEVVIVPNGVDVAGTPWRPPTTDPVLAYIGLYSYRPNERAALLLAREILPMVRTTTPDARLILVGADPTPAMYDLEGPDITVTGRVDDAVAHLHQARVLVISLKAGSGTRLKVLEAMAAGVPVVSTPTGVAGLGVVDRTHVLLGETPAELAAAAQRVVEDDALAAGLSHRGRELVETRFDWSVCAAPMLELHDRLLRR